MKNILLLMLFLVFLSCSKDDKNEIPPQGVEDPNIPLSSDSSITSFKLLLNNELVEGDIDQVEKTINFNVVGANLESLAPVIEYNANASIVPDPDIAQDFNDRISYTVFAEDRSSTVYFVDVAYRDTGSENKILTFSVDINGETIDAEIDDENNTIKFNAGFNDISSLTPEITISDYATISPEIGESQNFNNEISYTVTSESGESNVYNVIVNKPYINGFEGSIETAFSGASLRLQGQFLNSENPNMEIVLSNGTTEFPLNVINERTLTNADDANIILNFIDFEVPLNTPTNDSYSLIYRSGDIDLVSPKTYDILFENAPNPMSVGQDIYHYHDILVINGENLTDTILIPSNGSIFVIENSNNYDLEVNPERTTLTLTLDYHALFPSYYADPMEEKTITFAKRTGANSYRIGKEIRTYFD